MKRLALGVMALFVALVMIVACSGGSGKSKSGALGCAACSGACSSYGD